MIPIIAIVSIKGSQRKEHGDKGGCYNVSSPPRYAFQAVQSLHGCKPDDHYGSQSTWPLSN